MSLCRDAYNFDVPLEKVFDRKFIMRLDQGPTASFKDFAARMMSRLMQYFYQLTTSILQFLLQHQVIQEVLWQMLFMDLRILM